MGLRNISFGTAIYQYDPPPEERLRALVERWADQFAADDFAEDISAEGTKAWTVSYDVATQHIDLLVSRLRKVLSELRSI